MHFFRNLFPKKGGVHLPDDKPESKKVCVHVCVCACVWQLNRRRRRRCSSIPPYHHTPWGLSSWQSDRIGLPLQPLVATVAGPPGTP